ncbi:hypothetical protein [Caldilinea sp.]|uniref:hypothetical protein n=1 Tax=Caldilinea sp. TaxID=2293560 RepID=UPI002CF98ED1|nr:hypothetical protein [Caldilinea sp.]HRA64475.1 hypothetical protein [Caldilinea sp.]
MNKMNMLCSFLVLLFGAAACISLPTGLKQHRLRVVDAESGAHLAAAAVTLHYFPSSPEAPEPNPPRATADAQGVVIVRSKAEPAIWQVQAPGYIEQRLASSKGEAPPRYAATATEEVDGVIHLYRMPMPALTIQMDEAYTGPLTINLHPAPGFDFLLVDEISTVFAAVDPQANYIQEASGRRAFTATASTEGQVDLLVTPLLFDIQTHQLQVADDTDVLPFRDIANPQDTARGVWGIVNEDDKRIHHQIRLFVGTLDDYLRALKTE